MWSNGRESCTETKIATRINNMKLAYFAFKLLTSDRLPAFDFRRPCILCHSFECRKVPGQYVVHNAWGDRDSKRFCMPIRILHTYVYRSVFHSIWRPSQGTYSVASRISWIRGSIPVRFTRHQRYNQMHNALNKTLVSHRPILVHGWRPSR